MSDPDIDSVGELDPKEDCEPPHPPRELCPCQQCPPTITVSLNRISPSDRILGFRALRKD